MRPEKPTVKRRSVIKAGAGLLSVTTLSLPAAAQQRQYYIQQGDQCWEVEPLSYQNEDVRQFYGYNNFHSHTSTGIEESDTSHLFLYRDPDGTLSLVAIHDISSHDDHGSDDDTGGGAVSFDFTGLPGRGWLVYDDVGDFNSSRSVPDKIDWAWGTANTDGGAYSGLGGDFDVSISPRFNDDAVRDPFDPGEISFWCFLSGDAEDPNGVLLDMEDDVRIVHSAEPPCDEPITDLPDECVHEVGLDIKPCSDPNAINPKSKGLIPVGIQGESDFDVSNIVVDSLRFGAIGNVEAEPAHNGHIEDTVPCEGNGIDDLVVHFPTEDTGFEQDDELGKLTGRLQDGSAIIGFDTVKIVGGKGGGGGPGGP